MTAIKPYLKYYRYIALAYVLLFGGYMVWDDWGLISRYWNEHWLESLWMYGLYILVYSIPVTLAYAGICVVHFLKRKQAAI